MPSFLSESFPEEGLSKPLYRVKVEKDIFVRMRDGVHVAIDVYRPDAPLRLHHKERGWGKETSRLE